MNAVRQQAMRDLLVAKRKMLLGQIARTMGESLDEDIRMSFEAVQDNPDKSVDELLKHVDASVLGARSKELDNINEALLKLREGTYGMCEECGCDIPMKRLQAVPFALYCRDCQADIEREASLRDGGGGAEVDGQGDDYLSDEE